MSAKHQQILREQTIGEDEPGRVLRDFEVLLNFVGQRESGTAMVWNARTGQRERILQGAGGVLIRRARGNLTVFRADRLKEEFRPLTSAAFSPVDSNFVITASADKMARVEPVSGCYRCV